MKYVSTYDTQPRSYYAGHCMRHGQRKSLCKFIPIHYVNYEVEHPTHRTRIVPLALYHPHDATLDKEESATTIRTLSIIATIVTLQKDFNLPVFPLWENFFL